MIREERGFTLVETLAALLVFSIMTLGIVPLVLSSVRGANQARAFTVGKNVALEAMERIRGLPFHTDYTRQPATTKVDFLDLYYSDDSGGALASQTYSAGLFTTTCDSTSTNNPACLADRLPDELTNFQLIVRACFVASGATECIDDSANRVVPTNYQWNPSATTESDNPRSQLVEVSVTTRWQLQGASRTYDIRTLISDKEFGGVALRGAATISTAVEVSTNYLSSGFSSNAVASFGTASSTVQTTALRTSAEQSATAAELTLSDTTDPDETVDLVTPLQGATVGLLAPPTEASDAIATSQALAHPAGHPLTGTDVAFVNESATTTSSAEVVTELPAATGGFEIDDTDASDATDPLTGWLTNASDQAALQIDASQPLFTLDDDGDVAGTTFATANAVGSGVSTGASLGLPGMGLFPSFGIGDDGDTGEGDPVLLIDDFESEVACESEPTGTATADAGWSARLLYWAADTAPFVDPANPTPDELTDGDYVEVLLGSEEATDPLALLGPNGTNPVVIQGIDEESDVYLFPFTHDPGVGPSHDHLGFLDPTGGLSSTVSEEETVDADNRVVSASVNQAINIKTVPVSSTDDDSFMTISVGSLSCSANDQR